MPATLCIIGGCNGAGKTTLARELLPRLGLMRFLNADEIARGLSPLDSSLVAFKAGRLVIEEARSLIAAGSSFALDRPSAETPTWRCCATRGSAASGSSCITW